MAVDKYTVFFKRECEVILNKVADTIYDNLEALQCIPLAPAEGPGVETLTWRSFTSVGIAKIISDYATDIPSVETYGAEQSAKVYHIAASFGWTKFELEKAMRAGRGLLDTKSKAARIAMETEVDDLAWSGDARYNIPGFLNYPGVSFCILADNEAGTSKKWADKTPEEMAQDINDIIDTITDNTSNKEKPNTVLLPPKLYRMAATKFVDVNKTVSVLDFIKKCNPEITSWRAIAKLAHAGADGGGRIIAYDNNPDKLEFHMPVAINNEEPERDGLKFDVILTGDVGGTTIYYPLSVCMADGSC